MMGINFDLSRFNSKIEENKVEIKENHYGVNYCLMVLLNGCDTQYVEFSEFTFDDLNEVEDILDSVITDEDMSGNILLDPNSPFAQIYALGWKISKLCNIPRNRATSPFMFI